MADPSSRRALAAPVVVAIALSGVALVTTSRRAVAQPDPAGAGAGSGAPAGEEETSGDAGMPIGIEATTDDDFGPVIVVEQIEVRGNKSTAERVIRRALPIVPGDVVNAGDQRMRNARFKLLALGFFRDVTLSMRKGSAHGRVVLIVDVVERGTLVLNRLWFGSSKTSTYWFGADVGDRNLFGTGLAIGAGGVYAGEGGIEGSRDQWAGELRVAASAIRGTRWGAFGSVTGLHGSEPYRVAGELDDDDAANFDAFPYRRLGARGGATYDLSALLRLSAAYRAEVIDASTPVAPTRTEPDGTVVPVDLHLEPGRSRVMTLSFGLDIDTRPDPVLPHDGRRLRLGAELGASMLGGSYDFVAMLASYEHWWPLRRGNHAIGLRLAGGVIMGDAPRFDRIHIGDVQRMVTPRAFGLAVSAASPPDFLGTRREDDTYGEVGGNVVVEYVARLFRREHHVYGGDLFVGVGLWSLADRDDFRVRSGSVWDALPVDLLFDIGLRIDTEIGIFEFTLANALGRVPL